MIIDGRLRKRDMDEPGDTRQPGQGRELLVTQLARSKTDVAKWDLSILVFLFAVLVIVIILTSLEIATIIVALVAITGLAAVWLVGWRRDTRLFPHYYEEVLSDLQAEPSLEVTVLTKRLTDREIQVLDYVAQGYANKVIASKLGISVNTVKVFVSSILVKLEASDRTQAVVIAIKHGIVSIR